MKAKCSSINSCNIRADTSTFGDPNCGATSKQLVLQATCVIPGTNIKC